MKKPSQHYPDASASPDFSKLETEVLKAWKSQQIFKQSVDARPTCDQDGKNNEFIFYDGPPFANGLPHYGHLLTGYVKDIIARFQTLKGKRVERRFGWDCHGLPAEMGAEKELHISGRQAIMDYGIDKFNDHCRTSVMKYASAWEEYVERQARWVDFSHDYKTMDTSYMESVLWAFKQLYDKGLVYESMRVMPYSWACQTPLSNFETRMDNAYRERADKAVTVGFKINDNAHQLEKIVPCDEYRFMAWTTTPWTLPSNLALAVGADMDYTLVPVQKEDGSSVGYILAHFAVKAYAKELGLSEEQLGSLKTFKGATLQGITYTPLFEYFKDHPGAFKVLTAAFVVEGDGTGIVHLAPGFGEDDMAVCQEHGIELVCPVDSGGCYTAEVTDYVGLQVFDANDEIIKHLKKDGNWIKTEQYLHNYPHCWRTDTPLIYKAVPSWYVEVTKFKDRMVELNQQINWIPNHIKDGQFGKWLENARDWSISRNRFWGSPIPVWKSDNPKNDALYVFGSIKELEEFFGTKVTDLHRPFIDELTKPDPLDKNYTIRRVEDVFDCWFESGSMPFAQVHYPFENKDWLEKHFPADFIVEYIAQTRGWFYTLMVLSTALFDRPPFLNCICHGVVLDEKGQKLSKRLNNYADPKDIFNHYGSDAMRWVMVSAPIMHGGELLIDKEGNMVRDAVRLVLKPVWNAYHFFTLYANADGIIACDDTSSTHVMDRYILSKCYDAVAAIDLALSEYDLPRACKAVEAFYEVLNNWYIRRNKDRFWKSEQDGDKQTAYNTLFTVQKMMAIAMSPLLPLTSEIVYQGLHGKLVSEVNGANSVHLQDYPLFDVSQQDSALVANMDLVRDVCNAALSVRNAENIRVRQPLKSLTIVRQEVASLKACEEIIKDEINVKSIAYQQDVASVSDFSLKIHFPILGKRLPQKMKTIIAASKQGQWEQQADGKLKIADEILQDDEYELKLLAKNPKGAQSLSTNDALVVLDLNIDEDLKLEGIARDVIRLVQQSRKEADLNIADRIHLSVQSSHDDVVKSVIQFKDYIAEQTLALTINTNDNDKNVNMTHRFALTLENNPIEISFFVA